MTRTVTIAILDNNRYFAQGLEMLLNHHFTLRNVLVRFFPEQHSADATLLFQGSSINRSAQFCRQRHIMPSQRVISVQDTSRASRQRRGHCLSEQGIIDCHTDVKALLLDVERVLAQPLIIAPVGKCPRCAQTLTQREYEILSTLSRMKCASRVARLMCLSPKTVSAHKRSAMRKLGFTRNIDLYYWLQNGGLNYEIRELS
jgi:DNA-binding NarL/FixJ family response regulator